MARTYTNVIPLGFTAPEFSLPEVRSDALVSYKDIRGTKGTVVLFICNHCPYVIHIRPALLELARNYMAKGIGFVAVSSNDVVNYPDDRPELMKQLAEEERFPFPYLYDEAQEVARAYDAACTPDLTVFDANDKAVYRGQFDGSRPGNGIPPSGGDLKEALEALLRGEQPKQEGQIPSMGCNIKWKQA